MTCHGDHRNGDGVFQQSINRDDSLRATPNEHARVFLYQTFLVPMVRREVEVPSFDELVPDATHHLCVIAVAQLRYKNANGQSPPIAKRPCQQAWLVIHLDRKSTRLNSS